MTVQARFVQRETLTLEEHGLNPERILPNLTVPRLIEYALRREEGIITDHGAFAAVTTPKTGRSPKDKFVVAEPGSESEIWWDKNARMEASAFDRLHADVRGFLDTRELFVQDLFGGAELTYQLSVRFISPSA